MISTIYLTFIQRQRWKHKITKNGKNVMSYPSIKADNNLDPSHLFNYFLSHQKHIQTNFLFHLLYSPIVHLDVGLKPLSLTGKSPKSYRKLLTINIQGVRLVADIECNGSPGRSQTINNLDSTAPTPYNNIFFFFIFCRK